MDGQGVVTLPIMAQTLQSIGVNFEESFLELIFGELN
jgi:hypothetical protein